MKLLSRKDVPVEDTWDLTPIYASDQSWEDAYLQQEEALSQLLKTQPAINSATDLLSTLHEYNQMMEHYSRLGSYALYKYSEDSTDQYNQSRMGRSQLLGKKVSSFSSRLVNKLLELSEERMATFLKEEKGLTQYHRFIEKLNLSRPHTLEPNVEKALSAVKQPLNVGNTIYMSITSSDMTFEDVKDKDGRDVSVSLFTYMTQIETSPDTVLRRNAYESLSEGLKKYQHGLAQSLTNEIQKNVAMAHLRQYPSTLDYLLHYASPANNQFYAGDEVSADYFEGVLDTFQQHLAPHMQRYARLRKEQLGLESLKFSDVKAPLDSNFDPSITFEEAGDIIVAAVEPLGREYQDLMRKAFTDRWVYRGNNVGRRMIAFGGGVHGVHGYSFYPWGGNLFDLVLLGHELGHAVHANLSANQQKMINNGQSLLFVEAPSTLVEHLIVSYLKKNRRDARLHRWLNMYLMMSYHHNCVTHILEAELLRRLYKMADAGTPLSTNVMNETKGAILKEFWGDTVEIDEDAKLTWMRQPHYYMGLYPFTYSIGTSASTVIANQIETEGEQVGASFTNVLKMGGTLSGLELYKQAGIDMANMNVIKEAIHHVGQIVDELEQSF